MSLRCPQVCATGRLERPLQCVVVILRLAERRIMLVPHEWTLSYSRGIVVVVVVFSSAPPISCTLIPLAAVISGEFLMVTSVFRSCLSFISSVWRPLLIWC